MTFETALFTGIFLTGLAGIAASSFSSLRYSKMRRLVEFAYARAEELEDALAHSNAAIDASAEQLADMKRRVVWLETRLRQPRTQEKPSHSTEEAAETRKADITERRHRVLALANSGQSVETIAARLGMLTGEVELIVNINRADYAQLN